MKDGKFSPLEDVVTFIKQISKNDFTVRQIAIFLIVYSSDGKYGGSLLATRLLVDPAVTSRALARLEKLGLVYRRQNFDYDRIKPVMRTDRGRALMAPLFAVHQLSKPDDASRASKLCQAFVAMSHLIDSSLTLRQAAIFIVCYLDGYTK